MNYTMHDAVDDQLHKLRMGLTGIMGLMRVGTKYEHKLARKHVRELKDIANTVNSITEYSELRKKVKA